MKQKQSKYSPYPNTIQIVKAEHFRFSKLPDDCDQIALNRHKVFGSCSFGV